MKDKPFMEFQIDNLFKAKALKWASTFEHFCFLNYTGNNQSYSQYPGFPSLLAVGAKHTITPSKGSILNELKNHFSSLSERYYGYLGYDVKNEIEKLSSNNAATIQFPEAFFFSPIYSLEFKSNLVYISGENPIAIFDSINSQKEFKDNISYPVKINHRVSKEDYVSNVNQIKHHIEEGDVYELNYCIEFFAEETQLDPIGTFMRLMQVSPMAFSVLFKNKNQYLLSASPERFLKKQDSKLVAQPMKGTARRNENPTIDQQLKEALKSSEKEQAENMMIVDLMRNDLARSSQHGSVKVEELFEVYTLSTVHQMVSTVTSEIKPDIHFIDVLKNAFPMGSMTGAPKIKAMELIDKFEASKRGLFSGSFGYITPNGDFDFNVLIRGLIYDEEKKCLSFWAGSAITYDSDPEKEYEECLLKASAIMKVLGC